MVPIPELWLRILLSAVLSFIASSIAHMVLPHHKGDYGKLPSEADIMAAMGKAGVTPGDYLMPCMDSPSAMKDPAFIEKMTKGPVARMTIVQAGPRPWAGSSRRGSCTAWS